MNNGLIEQCANLPMYQFENGMIWGFENEVTEQCTNATIYQ